MSCLERVFRIQKVQEAGGNDSIRLFLYSCVHQHTSFRLHALLMCRRSCRNNKGSRCIKITSDTGCAYVFQMQNARKKPPARGRLPVVSCFTDCNKCSVTAAAANNKWQVTRSCYSFSPNAVSRLKTSKAACLLKFISSTSIIFCV